MSFRVRRGNFSVQGLFKTMSRKIAQEQVGIQMLLAVLKYKQALKHMYCEIHVVHLICINLCQGDLDTSPDASTVFSYYAITEKPKATAT